MRNFLIVGCMLALLTACGSSVKLDPASVEDKNAKGVPKGSALTALKETLATPPSVMTAVPSSGTGAGAGSGSASGTGSSTAAAGMGSSTAGAGTGSSSAADAANRSAAAARAAAAGSGAAGAGAAGSGAAGAGAAGASKSDSAAAATARSGPIADPRTSPKVIYFDYNSSEIKSEGVELIDAHARFLIANKTRQVSLEGHTDERGGREFNLALGQKRAEAVRTRMRLLGVTDIQMEAVSFGKEKPAAAGNDDAAHAKNRRAEINYAR
ncbi:MAG: peptidoglycan-associated lipoprotein Pal [Pseudomonadota bacterium]